MNLSGESPGKYPVGYAMILQYSWHLHICSWPCNASMHLISRVHWISHWSEAMTGTFTGCMCQIGNNQLRGALVNNMKSLGAPTNEISYLW